LSDGDTDLWTAEEAAAEVGIEVQTIYTWTARGYLTPAGKRGRFNLYRLDDVFKAEATRQHKHRKHQ
jgi:DNA-binding transcriptional MerR regulator